ncbi:MAG TPA: 3-dehydroquinate synthase [Opitutus sp.]|nr:3-dehydroquinate synthase [Opitutus sp.]
MSETLSVHLAERSYVIHFGRDVCALIGNEIKRRLAAGRKIAVLTDRNLSRSQGTWFRSVFGDVPTLVVDAGESAKSLVVLGQVLDFLAEHKLDRGGALFAVGGGVMGDLGGFAAASWLRGIDFYQVPTTLLAMVDSSVGGKTGINIAAGKNLVGAFHQPRGVFIATDLLTTLPPREFAAGLAEVIKSALLGDESLLARLERSPLTVNSPDLAEVIHRCCALKAKFVESDERELAKEGGRALLNLGHTFGHAIENVAGYGVYLHGEAIAIGLCAAARLSQKLGGIGPAEVARVDALVAAHGLPTRLREPLTIEALFTAMSRDKKVRSGSLRFVILKKLGEAVTRDDVPLGLAEASFREVGAGA